MHQPQQSHYFKFSQPLIVEQNMEESKMRIPRVHKSTINLPPLQGMKKNTQLPSLPGMAKMKSTHNLMNKPSILPLSPGIASTSYFAEYSEHKSLEEPQPVIDETAELRNFLKNY